MANTPRLEGRTGQIWKMTVMGKTQEAIAEHFGIDQSRVSQIIAEVRAAIPPLDKEALVQREIDFLETIRDRTEDLALMELPPAFSQKGEMLVDRNGNPVLDTAGRVSALKLHLDIQARLAKMVGLEAPTKVDATVTDAVAQAVAAKAAAAAARLLGRSEDDGK